MAQTRASADRLFGRPCFCASCVCRRGSSKFDTGHDIDEIGITASVGIGEITAREELGVAGSDVKIGADGIGHEQVEFAPRDDAKASPILRWKPSVPLPGSAQNEAMTHALLFGPLKDGVSQ